LCANEQVASHDDRADSASRFERYSLSRWNKLFGSNTGPEFVVQQTVDDGHRLGLLGRGQHHG
jgi:hypothetical protein